MQTHDAEESEAESASNDTYFYGAEFINSVEEQSDEYYENDATWVGLVHPSTHKSTTNDKFHCLNCSNITQKSNTFKKSVCFAQNTESNKNISCRLCKRTFYSNNKLHIHLSTEHLPTTTMSKPKRDRDSKPNQQARQIISPSGQSNKVVVKSTGPPNSFPPGSAFLVRRYAEIKLMLASPENNLIYGVLDTGCTMSLIDK
ncbi:hypothetical protein OnM2_084041 [Erysiphe neolycopersici]|uniref:C2H2-type domain-containing protein n=1 Tax=Erysiphe neolycopersici TaxID=212602 RepID=A0A420HF83_9PEZI|nr:hypothetical protein OnM2_084041 [Erysiphe neolycopersici]